MKKRDYLILNHCKLALLNIAVANRYYMHPQGADLRERGDSITTAGAYQTSFHGGSGLGDAFIAKFDSMDYATGINEIASISENKVVVYPNPNNGIFTIESSVVSGKSLVEIYNVLGQTVYQSQLKSANTQIDLSNQPSGIYLYRVISKNGELIGSGKLVIE